MNHDHPEAREYADAAPGLVQCGRIALRHEGVWWVAYYAQSDSMEGALELARVAIGLVDSNGPRYQQFIQLARDLFADVVEKTLGVRPEFPQAPQPAPEHERSGNG